MSEMAYVIIIILIWVFRHYSGNYHLREKEQEIENLAQDMENNKAISYSETYQRVIEQYKETQ